MRFNRRIEYFNEATIMIAVYHMFLFTDFTEHEIKWTIGTSFIMITLINLVGNVMGMLYMTSKQLRRLCKMVKGKMLQRKHLKKMKK